MKLFSLKRLDMTLV